MPPVQGQGRNNQPGPECGQEGNDRINGIRRLNPDHMVGGQANGGVEGGEFLDLALSLGVGQLAGFTAGPRGAVGRIHKGEAVRIGGSCLAEDLVERHTAPECAEAVAFDGICRRCNHGPGPLPGLSWRLRFSTTSWFRNRK